MPKKEKKETRIEEVKTPASPLSPLLSNIVSAHLHKDFVLLDFGFIGPSYVESNNMEDTQIARICIPWDAAEFLSEMLNDAISDRKKTKSKNRKKNK